MSSPDKESRKSFTKVVRVGTERACRDFSIRIEALGFQRTLKMAWTRQHPFTVDVVYFHRHGSTYGAPITASVDFRVEFSIRVLSDDFTVIAGPVSDPGTLRDGRYHLRFNAETGSTYDRCLEDLVRFVREQGDPWFEKWHSVDALLESHESPLRPREKELLRAARNGRSDTEKLAVSLRRIGIPKARPGKCPDRRAIPLSLGANDLAIHDAESKLGVTFPAALCDFYRVCNGIEMPPDWRVYAVFDPSNPRKSANHIVHANTAGRWPYLPQDYICLAQNGTGNQLVLKKSGPTLDLEIYVWDHETNTVLRWSKGLDDLIAAARKRTARIGRQMQQGSRKPGRRAADPAGSDPPVRSTRDYGNSPGMIFRAALMGSCLGMAATIIGFAGGMMTGTAVWSRAAWLFLPLLVLPGLLALAVAPTVLFRIRIVDGRVRHVFLGRCLLSDFPLRDYMCMRRFDLGCAAVLHFRNGGRIHFFGAHMREISRLERDLSEGQHDPSGTQSSA
jgi:hypothetical protein